VPQPHSPGGLGHAPRLVRFERQRLQRSPAIMNVAVPFSQHSQWFGHFALSQTVCSFNSPSRLRVRAKLSDVGSLMRSQSGRRGRVFNSTTVIGRQFTKRTSNIQH
jgi:hypothetical protein